MATKTELEAEIAELKFKLAEAQSVIRHRRPNQRYIAALMAIVAKGGIQGGIASDALKDA